jgi:hypothetical protein
MEPLESRHLVSSDRKHPCRMAGHAAFINSRPPSIVPNVFTHGSFKVISRTSMPTTVTPGCSPSHT